MSAARIITADTYDEEGSPIPSGLMDLKLGVIEPGQRCQTCGNRVEKCLGHFGHIELARPVVHVSYAKVLLKILRSVCHNCSALMLTDEVYEEYRERQDKFTEIFKKPNRKLTNLIMKVARKTTECPNCGASNRKITIEKPTTFYEEDTKEKEGTRRLTAQNVLERLKGMSEPTMDILGINPDSARPEWMILTVLPIPPVCVRPSITLESGIRSEDDLTHKLVDVIRINQRLRENIESGAPQLIVEDLWELLQYHITTYFNNEVAGIPPARHRSGRALRTLTQRLKGKEGRFRSNLSGKRVDFSARTVISPNPHISINQVGVPKEVAMTLTVPIAVTEYNIEEMKQSILNGPKKHPGANYIIREDGNRVDLRFVKKRDFIASTIKPGFIVERHLQNEDLVLFNRQPSLHRMSIMAHKVRVMEGHTFRLSLTVCPPYNADFDGDEMNLHVPQSEEARTEAEFLLQVQEHIVSPRYGRPIIGGIQDFISMAYMFTRKEIREGLPNYFDIKDTYNLLHWGNIFERKPYFRLSDLTPVNPEADPKDWLFTGKQIFSTLLPYDLNIRLKSKFCKACNECQEEDCTYDAFVSIENGVLKTGVIDEKSFGDGEKNSILARVVKDYGNTRGRQFLDDTTSMLIWVIIINALTMGVDEVDIGPALDLVHEEIDNKNAEAMRLVTAYFEGDEEVLPCSPGRTLEETLELNLIKLLNDARNKAGDIAMEHLGVNAHSVIMTKSGARGNQLNLAQMAACVGQQSVRQNRIHRGYTGRTLPHFKLKDLSPKARGFVTSSYRVGLNPTEFFFHAMGGREGLVDTAVRTSTSGYMQRRLVNALQDMVVSNDYTVRTSNSNVIQFSYGDDNIDPGRSDNGHPVDLEFIEIKTKALRSMLEQEDIIKERQEDANVNHDSVDLNRSLQESDLHSTMFTGGVENIEEFETKTVEAIESRKLEASKLLKKRKTQRSKRTTRHPSKKSLEERSNLSEEELMNIFEEETGKNAIWRGSTTKQFREWRDEYLEK